MSAARPLNIVYILSDDLGYGDVSCLNPESKIQTPRLDALAAQGMIFTDAHSNSAVCTPTRYGILTGRYCWRSRLKSSVLWGYSPALIEPERTTVASYLSDHGYRTACIGKWHLGLGWSWPKDYTPTDTESTEDPGIDFSQTLTEGPHTVGFQESYILPASLDMPPYCYVHNGRVTAPPTDFTEGSPRPPLWRSGACSPGFDHQSCLLEFTRRAEAYIDHHAASHSDRPFFLYFATPSPHTPHCPRTPFQQTSEAGPYGDLVVEHDWSVGCLLDALERNGLAENTLIIVTSDNGAHMRGDAFDFEQEFAHRSNHFYRGQKSDCWDGGHRVPFIVRCPSVVQPGSVCTTPVCLTDLLTTAAEICRSPLPAEIKQDGASMIPLLKGEAEGDHRVIVHHSIDGHFAVRCGPWKLILCRGSGGWSLPEDDADLEAPEIQLYHVENDPREEENLIHRKPQVAARLLASLKKIRDSV
jgi:arylsulfatase A-like enzyme